MTTYEQIVGRWRDKCIGIDDRPNYSSSNKIYASGDVIYSYGSHFEMGRALRHRDQSMRGWLLNGDRFSNTTSKHQAVLLSKLNSSPYTYDRVTIPFTALDAAGIDRASVHIVQSTSDWWEDKQEYFTEMPDSAKWQYMQTTADKGGWRNTKTGEFQPRLKDWGQPPPKQVTCLACKKEPDYLHYMRRYPEDRSHAYAEYEAAHSEWQTHQRARHGVWEEVTHHTRNTGQKTLVSRQGWSTWDLVDHGDSPTGVFYVREWRRHWLGESLIKAQVRYQGRQHCPECQHTGQVKRWSMRVARDGGYGPLTQHQDAQFYWSQEHYAERVVADRMHEHRTVAVHEWTTMCRSCNGTGWQRITRWRWAYFLSGFDSNESRPSYFFCELPPGSRPFTVAEAYEALKPAAVRLAEELEREVERQGDIYWIPMPELSLRQLKQQGGRHIRRKVEVIEVPRTWGGTERRMGWADGVDPSVLSTNHTATEQVRVGRLTYARGTLRHEPDRRRPDHARIRLGDGKTWGLVVKNTVPIGA